MKNYLYCQQIGEKIKELLDRELSKECAKNISTGDFGILPEPENLNRYLPAVLIDNTAVNIEDVNPTLDIVRMEHVFDIYYLYPYSFMNMEDVSMQAKIYLGQIANSLMNYRGLEGLSFEAAKEESGGFIEGTSLEGIVFSSAETKLFRAMEIPANIGKLEYKVLFRTYQRRQK